MNDDQDQNQQANLVNPQLQGQYNSVQNQTPSDVAQVVTQPVAQKQPESFAGSFNKEVAPIIREAIAKPSETEPKLHSEVKEAGVETVSEKLEIKKEHTQAGIEHAKESVPVKTEPSPSITVPNSPMTEQKARETLRLHKKISNSVLWMAISVLRQIKKDRKSEKVGGL